ncbi:Fpg/Nei family DNA glycosylase [Nocardioides acrostichi]|uniref:DNA-(apurinic or apyrimidinic site) lyase n=1 Tax=Nocardioides acrostichi TaxID=2784339 RepID=A0A930YD11_9ACTN|nr:Fpg/Nei family DNA glycosylase [Nocardioides acrostichi]MBF4161994.1 Fpg/Nei family DNA glycosylase [Nocardioides acrostichi]
MPEGHTIHRLARRHRRLLRGHRVEASSPQGRFAEGAALLDGARLTTTDAWGKHLFHVYDDQWLHVHLGLFGRYRDGRGQPPTPRGALRLRLVTRTPDSDTVWLDLRGPTACELLTEPEVRARIARLGPDPLRPDSDPDAFYDRVLRSRSPIGTLLMNQSVIAGVGNVYRSEVLYRAGLEPHRLGRELDATQIEGIWDDLRHLMNAGVKAGRIVTTEPVDRERPVGRARRVDAHYVYGRAGEPCRRCSAEVLAADLAARTVFWCPVCQP